MSILVTWNKNVTNIYGVEDIFWLLLGNYDVGNYPYSPFLLLLIEAANEWMTEKERETETFKFNFIFQVYNSILNE